MIYSNEIVFRGHPDKVCDQISDALLDAYLKDDENSRCAIETMGGGSNIYITGEVTSESNVNVKEVTKRVLKDIGYDENYNITIDLRKQSSDIAKGVDTLGAGDQGMMFGYATNETKEYLPLAMVILQKLSKKYDNLRKKDKRFLPDGKAQITGYYEKNKLIKIKTFTISYNNTEKAREETDKILKDIIFNILKEHNLEVEEFLINPTGKFLVGGFTADTGLTGRKIVVDTYHSFAKVGGGAFSGKDLTKVDRSGAYIARDIAKEYLDKYNLEYCEVQIAYAIGIKKPLSIYINSNKGLIKVPSSLYERCKVENIVNKYKHLKFEETAKYGHFIN